MIAYKARHALAVDTKGMAKGYTIEYDYFRRHVKYTI